MYVFIQFNQLPCSSFLVFVDLVCMRAHKQVQFGTIQVVYDVGALRTFSNKSICRVVHFEIVSLFFCKYQPLRLFPKWIVNA